MSWAALILFLAASAVALPLVWRRPVYGLYALVVGLVLHTAGAFGLFLGGVEGWQLTVIQAWKELVLATVLARVAWDVWRARALPFRPGLADWLAVAFVAVAFVYAVIPQDLLGGAAGAKGRLFALRQELLPVAGFLAGRSLRLGRAEVRRAFGLMLGAAAVTALAGIAEEYLVSLDRWRSSGGVEFFTDQLDTTYHGPAGLPDNFVLNTTEGVYRRLVSFFLSPLGSAYMFVAVLCIAAAGALGSLRRPPVAAAVAAVSAGLLFSFTRSALLALAGGLLVLAFALRRPGPVAAAAAVLAVSVGFAALFPQIAPEARFYPEDQTYLEEQARRAGPTAEGSPLDTTVRLADPSSRAHLNALEEGARRLASHPHGYGVGNSGYAAARFGAPLQATESTYLELGVDVGVVGLALWLAFSAAVFVGLFRRAREDPDAFRRRVAAGVFAALAALSAIGLLSPVWGFPWTAIVVWWLAGSVLSGEPAEPVHA